MQPITDLLLLYQDSKMAVPLWLPNNPGTAQGRTPRVQQSTAAWDQPPKPRGSEELHDLDAPSRIFQAHWLCFWLPGLRVVLRLAARRWRATQGVGRGPESKHEAATSREILIAWRPFCVKFCTSCFWSQTTGVCIGSLVALFRVHQWFTHVCWDEE
jgi:hypothetical protein